MTDPTCEELTARITAAEVERDAALAALAAERAKVERLVEVLTPIASYVDMALVDGWRGEIGEIYVGGFRVSISFDALRAVRDVLAEVAPESKEQAK